MSGPGVTEKEEKWNKIQIDAKTLDDKFKNIRIAEDEAERLAGIPKYKVTKGERIRVREKGFYKTIADSTLISTITNDITKMKKESEAAGQIDGEVVEKLNRIEDNLIKLDAAWKKYTHAYSIVNREKYFGVRAEYAAGRDFKEILDECSKDVNDLMMYEVSENLEFKQVFSVVESLEGHYDEMMNGNLDVPADAPIKAVNNPNTHVKSLQQEIDDFTQPGMKVEVVYSDRKKEPIFSHEPTPNDVMQGRLKDCYLMASLCAMASTNPQLIKDMFKDNGDGTVTVALYPQFFRPGDVEGEPLYIKMEKSVPVIKVTEADGKVTEMDTFAKGSLWVQYVQKAYTASGVHVDANDVAHKDYRLAAEKGYRQIETGKSGQPFKSFFGKHEHKCLDYFKENPDKLFDEIQDELDSGHVIVTAITNMPEKYAKMIKTEVDKRVNELTAQGKVAGNDFSLSAIRRQVCEENLFGLISTKHAYTIIDTLEAPDENGVNQKYVVVRDPNAMVEYDGKTSAEEGINVNGYCVVPIKEFSEIFAATYSATPPDAGYRDNPASGYSNISKEMFRGLKSSRSFTAAITDMSTASLEFKDLYDALKRTEYLTSSPVPSERGLNKAFDKLAEKAGAYLEHAMDNPYASNDRNIRYCMAKASMKLAESYKNNQDPKEASRQIAEELIADRIRYALESKNMKESDKEMLADPARYTKFVSRLKTSELMDIAVMTKPEKIFEVMAKKQLQINASDQLAEERLAAESTQAEAEEAQLEEALAESLAANNKVGGFAL